MQQAAAPPATQEAAATGDVPPKQVAQALEQLGHMGRLIADVWLSADRLLVALFFVAEEPYHQHFAKCFESNPQRRVVNAPPPPEPPRYWWV